MCNDCEHCVTSAVPLQLAVQGDVAPCGKHCKSCVCLHKSASVRYTYTAIHIYKYIYICIYAHVQVHTHKHVYACTYISSSPSRRFRSRMEALLLRTSLDQTREVALEVQSSHIMRYSRLAHVITALIATFGVPELSDIVDFHEHFAGLGALVAQAWPQAAIRKPWKANIV